MHAFTLIILPIFTLIFAGYICRKTERLGRSAASQINLLVVWLCLPALLFQVTSTASWKELWNPEFVMAFGIGALLTFSITFFYSLATGNQLASSSIDGLSAGYPNTGYIGIPLCAMLFGNTGLQPALMSTLIILFIPFALSVVIVEIGQHQETKISQALVKVFIALMKNPLVVSPIVGIIWNCTGLGLAGPVQRLLELLSAATTPCALVSLGLFLAEKSDTSSASPWPLVGLKLFLQPAITWFLAFEVFELSETLAICAVLLSALPTGTGPFMLAEYYKIDVSRTSRAVLISTLVSLFTLSYFIAHFNLSV